MDDNSSEPTVYTIKEIKTLLRVGDHTARRLGRELGIRVSPRRIIIPRAAVERYLATSEAKSVTTTTSALDP